MSFVRLTVYVSLYVFFSQCVNNLFSFRVFKRLCMHWGICICLSFSPPLSLSLYIYIFL